MGICTLNLVHNVLIVILEEITTTNYCVSLGSKWRMLLYLFKVWKENCSELDWKVHNEFAEKVKGTFRHGWVTLWAWTSCVHVISKQLAQKYVSIEKCTKW